MCTQGVNLTQFKLSLHQIGEVVKVNKKSVEQWSELLNRLNFPDLSKKLKECEEFLERARVKLDETLKETSELEHQHEEDVEITPM
jgi:hypothetical protein